MLDILHIMHILQIFKVRTLCYGMFIFVLCILHVPHILRIIVAYTADSRICCVYCWDLGSEVMPSLDSGVYKACVAYTSALRGSPEGPQGASGGKFDGFIEVKRYFWLSPGGGHGGTSHAKRRMLRGAGKTPHFDLNHQKTCGFSRVL